MTDYVAIGFDVASYVRAFTSSQNIQAEKEWYAGLSRCEGYDVGRMGGNEKELAMDQNNI